MNDGHKVSGSERAVRFGCGLVVGLVLGFFLSIQFDILSIPIAIGAAILFGFLAVAFGERFWNALMKFGSWFGW